MLRQTFNDVQYGTDAFAFFVQAFDDFRGAFDFRNQLVDAVDGIFGGGGAAGGLMVGLYRRLRGAAGAGADVAYRGLQVLYGL